ncbi:MAG: protein-tyrosine-phosphatase [Brumimicrobium sp.]
MIQNTQSRIFNKIKKYCEELSSDFSEISSDRKALLDQIVDYISSKKKEEEINLVYVCTHNSRRSHFGQVWATVAADFYNIQNVNSYSAGTEQTAFHPNAIAALTRVGFKIDKPKEEQNPKYNVNFGENQSTTCFSKTLDHKTLPKQNFAAIMTCGDAEANCPFLPGAEKRIATTYEDPKKFDGTPQEAEKYDERCRQIALETLYVFYQFSSQK